MKNADKQALKSTGKSLLLFGATSVVFGLILNKSAFIAQFKKPFLFEEITTSLLLFAILLISTFIFQNLNNSPTESEYVKQEEDQSSLVSIVCSVLAGIIEEICFRGSLQLVLNSLLNSWLSIIIVSLIFALLHRQYKSWKTLVYIFYVSIVLGVYYQITESIWVCVVAHSLYNMFVSISISINKNKSN
ncbi:CPBP family intramembrane glutamic endopeptidase [Paenibacillus elgii]|uniref:CPBP family intramembrane glutamic endopeptidase n=1 Tax=Paenibacillus elgii TaxID=189691 RepID=UPI000248C6DC|nr:CPBP family intramembrane glutamic endopeptidase [Paenibacillus elgii]